MADLLPLLDLSHDEAKSKYEELPHKAGYKDYVERQMLPLIKENFGKEEAPVWDD
jgi:hypothetical protein